MFEWYSQNKDYENFIYIMHSYVVFLLRSVTFNHLSGVNVGFNNLYMCFATKSPR